jgi:hypothetical protein
MLNDQTATEFMQRRMMIGDVNNGDIISFGEGLEKYRVSDLVVNERENMIVAFQLTLIPE